MIIANGMAKSGTHALMAWLSRMGLKRCPGVLHVNRCGDLAAKGERSSARIHIRSLSIVPDSIFMQGHIPSTADLTGFMVITILRDPRNVLISYIRHRAQSWGGEKKFTIPEALADFWGKPFVETYEGFLGWQGRSIIVRYENLAPQHIGAGEDIYTPDRPQWDKWIGNTRTGSPSDWRSVWNDEAKETWRAAGGPDLLARAGYA